MSSPNYPPEISAIKDDYVRRKIDEHYLVDRLVNANSQVLSYEVKANDKIYPHPPTHYHIRFFINSFVGIGDDRKPILGKVHELSIKLPQNYPEQMAETNMLTPTWHPNIKSSGPFAGDICTNHKGFGGLYYLDELIVRIGEFLQYKRYLAEDRKPWPEDPEVARWVKLFAEPNGIVDKNKEVFADTYSWVVFLDKFQTPGAESDQEEDQIVFDERPFGEESETGDTPSDTDTNQPPANDEQITFL